VGVLDGTADLRAGQVGHHQLAGVAVQLDSATTDLQPEGVYGAGRRLTPGPVLASPATFAGSLPLARRTPAFTLSATTFARSTTALAARTSAASPPFAAGAATTLAPGAAPALTTGTATTRAGAALASRTPRLARRAAAALAPPLASAGPASPFPGRAALPLAARGALLEGSSSAFACCSAGALPTTTPPAAWSSSPARTLRGGVSGSLVAGGCRRTRLLRPRRRRGRLLGRRCRRRRLLGRRRRGRRWLFRGSRRGRVGGGRWVGGRRCSLIFGGHGPLLNPGRGHRAMRSGWRGHAGQGAVGIETWARNRPRG
jgi:hypothetical protein